MVFSCQACNNVTTKYITLVADAQFFFPKAGRHENRRALNCPKLPENIRYAHIIINILFRVKVYKTMDLSLLTKENVLFGTRLGAMALSGLWYGASQYITSVECPARYGVNLAISW